MKTKTWAVLMFNEKKHIFPRTYLSKTAPFLLDFVKKIIAKFKNIMLEFTKFLLVANIQIFLYFF